MDGKKGIALMLLERAEKARGKGKPPSKEGGYASSTSDEGETEGADEGKRAAAEDLLAAIAAKDADAVVEAIESLYEMC